MGEARELLTSLDAAAGMPANVARVPLTRLRTSLDALAAGLDELRELTEIELGRTLLREQPLQLRSLLEGCLRRAGVAQGLLVVAADVPQTLLGDPTAAVADRRPDAGIAPGRAASRRERDPRVRRLAFARELDE